MKKVGKIEKGRATREIATEHVVPAKETSRIEPGATEGVGTPCGRREVVAEILEDLRIRKEIEQALWEYENLWQKEGKVSRMGTGGKMRKRREARTAGTGTAKPRGEL
ncbi:MAG TPA: hypothetical protein DCZ94_20080 [Lentisphaeria bacterium]|nr:MAG: hypothetical protein A2X48_14725 [Lentisphaerae bacterium GWF2_49_21]HBC89245.1 hypothetical protein [Lentisphaeria bacterium]